MSDDEQIGLFGADEDFHRVWREWKGMPEFSHEDLQPHSTILVHFASADDRAAFEALVEQKLPMSTKRLSAIWYPRMGLGGYTDKRYRAETDDGD